MFETHDPPRIPNEQYLKLSASYASQQVYLNSFLVPKSKQKQQVRGREHESRDFFVIEISYLQRILHALSTNQITHLQAQHLLAYFSTYNSRFRTPAHHEACIKRAAKLTGFSELDLKDSLNVYPRIAKLPKSALCKILKPSIRLISCPREAIKHLCLHGTRSQLIVALMLFMRRMPHRLGRARLSLKLASEVGRISERSAGRAIKELQAAGLIIRSRANQHWDSWRYGTLYAFCRASLVMADKNANSSESLNSPVQYNNQQDIPVLATEQKPQATPASESNPVFTHIMDLDTREGRASYRRFFKRKPPSRGLVVEVNMSSDGSYSVTSHTAARIPKHTHKHRTDNWNFANSTDSKTKNTGDTSNDSGKI